METRITLQQNAEARISCNGIPVVTICDVSRDSIKTRNGDKDRMHVTFYNSEGFESARVYNAMFAN